MNDLNHERARKLLVTAAIEDITSDERKWLEGHLAACVECSSEARELAVAVGSLRDFHVTVSPDLLQRTRAAVRVRAEELNAVRAGSAPLWIATAISGVCMIVTALYVWRTLAWAARMTHVPEVFWQVGFLVCWFLPATALAAAAAWRHSKDDVLNWGQR
jgi:hypothetical protein